MPPEPQSNKGMLKSDETNVGGMKNVATIVRASIPAESCRVRIARQRVSFASSWLAKTSCSAMRCTNYKTIVRNQ